ncbi:M48 family metallopeptidase [Actinoplanes sp. NPDC020271]|uniref:M48 family metallopeptidase n=1 Tax=Actinoplanes sp. NPDC020271 TaxID=3363896 RepID=UPI003795BDB4
MSTGESCPKCAAATISKRSAEPWCPACEWNLDHFEKERRPEIGWRWVDRRLFRTAYWLTERQFAELRDAPSLARAATAARIATTAVSVVLLALVAALFVAGVVLLVHDFFTPINLIGALLVLIAVVLRPRLGRLSALTRDAEELDRGRAPALFAVIDRVAAAAGTPVPDVVLLSADFNASTTTVGVRRRRVLTLGAQLWSVLDPQERVALLGHELGHFVNGDIRRGLVTQAAGSTLGAVAYLLRPDGRRTRTGGLLGMIAEALLDLLAGTLARLVGLLHLLLLWISRRDSQRAEYLADELAAKVAGSAAAIRLSDTSLLYDAIDTVVRREARAGNGAAAWSAAGRQAQTGLAGDIPALRQLSRRTEASLFASHPPAGLRAGLLAARAAQPAAVIVTEAEQARMDEELGAHYERVRRELATAHW